MKKRVHHTHPNASAQQIIAHPMLDWERSDCDCCDDDRDWILDAQVYFDRDDDEGLRVYLVIRNSSSGAYWEYGDHRSYHDSMISAIVDAERWVRRSMREYKRQGRLNFDSIEPRGTKRNKERAA